MSMEGWPCDMRLCLRLFFFFLAKEVKDGLVVYIQKELITCFTSLNPTKWIIVHGNIFRGTRMVPQLVILSLSQDKNMDVSRPKVKSNSAYASPVGRGTRHDLRLASRVESVAQTKDHRGKRAHRDLFFCFRISPHFLFSCRCT